jgi:hypothetical protein
MLTLKLELNKSEDRLFLQMPNGDEHRCTEDHCDCTAAQFGNLCRHRLFIFAMGGFDALKKLIKAERRKAKRNNPT